ncbi:hypothetical protein JL722_5245 [Aureococcus anophagefferens]|nr:hypothetical protein JL722_5245 [Aureococcus anophagefferens]
MHATTVGEYKAFGGSAADLRHDIRKEFVKVILPAGVAAPARAAVVEDRAAVADLVLLNDEALAPASRSASTDYYHVLRKITQEVGIKKLRDAKAHGGELKRVVVLLHSCETLEQLRALAKLFTSALRERDDLILADYLTKPSTGYFVEPFNRWFVAANWLRQPDGTVKGARYGPSTQHGERYNKMLEDDILCGKRASKEHLLETIIPKLLKLDGARLGPFELMDVPTAIPSDVLAAARRVVKLQEYFVLAPKGAVTQPPRATARRTHLREPPEVPRPAVTRKLRAHEIGRHGRYTKALSVGDFEKRDLSLTRVEKTPEGWIAPTESYVFQGVCPSTTAALHLDRALDIDVVLQRLPCNKRAGRPTKKAAALTPQPAEVARRSLYDGPFEALVGRGAPPLRNRMGGDGRAQLTGRSEIGRRVCTWSANGATCGKVISAARNADASITFCVLDDDGQQRELRHTGVFSDNPDLIILEYRNLR